MSADKPCFICRGRAVWAIAVPAGGEDDELVYAVDVFRTSAVLHEVIAQRIRQHLAGRQHEDGRGE
jgi:hypothetical protein